MTFIISNRTFPFSRCKTQRKIERTISRGKERGNRWWAIYLLVDSPRAQLGTFLHPSLFLFTVLNRIQFGRCPSVRSTFKEESPSPHRWSPLLILYRTLYPSAAPPSFYLPPRAICFFFPPRLLSRGLARALAPSASTPWQRRSGIFNSSEVRVGCFR